MELRPILFGLRRSKTGAFLVAAQIALTIAIVCNALFVVRQRVGLTQRPSGVLEDRVFQIFYVPKGEIPDAEAMQQKDLETLRAIPGVAVVASVNSFPISTSGSDTVVTTDPSKPDTGQIAAMYYSGDKLIDAWGLRLLEGRDFEPTEVRERRRGQRDIDAEVVIISRDLARRLFPDGKAVGKNMYLGTGDDADPLRIVGVVDRLMSSRGELADTALSSMILPVRGIGSAANYAVRTTPGQTARVMKDAEKALTALRTDRVMIHNRTVADMRERRYRTDRSGANTLIAVTIGLLLVTMSGIVGISSLWVSQRRKQIGVRRALGARRRDIMRFVITENFLITTVGVLVGAGLAIGLNQFLMGKVEMASLPPAYVIGGMVAAWVLALIAVLGPAWRAASVPPAIATRSA